MKRASGHSEEASRRLRVDLMAAAEAALEAAHAGNAVRRVLSLDGEKLSAGEFAYDLRRFDRLIVLGAGKAVAPMAAAAAELLGPRVERGLVAPPAGYFEADPAALDASRIRIIEGEHPVPGEGSFRAGREMLRLSGECAGKKTLAFFLLSGGASAPLAAARAPLPPGGKSRLVDALVRSGAAIGEINCVRRHLSPIKGGGLLRALHPSEVCAIAVSDVPGNAACDIGSGPTVPDPTTIEDARRIIEKYAAQLSGAPLDPVNDALRETPKPGDPLFEKGRFLIAADNKLARETAADKLRALGYETFFFPDEITGDVEDAGKKLWLKWEEIRREAPGRPVALVAGGETTLRVEGECRQGGRCHELCLRMAVRLDGLLRPAAFLAMGTDGLDGTSGAAGAFATNETMPRTRSLALDPAAALRRHDTAPLFRALGDAIPRRLTDTNVMDLMIFLSR